MTKTSERTLAELIQATRKEVEAEASDYEDLISRLGALEQVADAHPPVELIAAVDDALIELFPFETAAKRAGPSGTPSQKVSNIELLHNRLKTMRTQPQR